jgi:hypothetical protein
LLRLLGTVYFMRKLFIVTLAAFFLISCTTGKQDGGEKPDKSVKGSETLPAGSTSDNKTYALEITPGSPARNSLLSLIPTGFALADARVEWYVNGSLVTTAMSHQLSAAELRKGDTVQARAFIDGFQALSGHVTIVNSPPEITRAEIVPGTVKPGEPLRVAAEGKDIDGDAVTYLYEWTRNGEAAGKGISIEAPLKKGDKVAVKVTPFDGEAYGFVAFLRREIGNMPPVIVENKEFTFDGSECTYQVKATDPDADALSYSLEKAPSGMSIDKSTGLIKWPVPSDFKGEMDVLVIVSDGQGGTAQCTQKITIK